MARTECRGVTVTRYEHPDDWGNNIDEVIAHLQALKTEGYSVIIFEDNRWSDGDSPEFEMTREATPEEQAEELAKRDATRQRRADAQERRERETYEQLHRKYGGE